jgi:hypothetical protein
MPVAECRATEAEAFRRAHQNSRLASWPSVGSPSVCTRLRWDQTLALANDSREAQETSLPRLSLRSLINLALDRGPGGARYPELDAQ